MVGIKSQPFAGGPALLSGFDNNDLRELIKEGNINGDFLLKNNLGISSEAFRYLKMIPGGPKEISEFNIGVGFTIIGILSGSGFCLTLDARKSSQYENQINIFRLIGGQGEIVLVPKDFGLSLIFASDSALFLMAKTDKEIGAKLNPFDMKINFHSACGIREKDLRLYSA